MIFIHVREGLFVSPSLYLRVWKQNLIPLPSILGNPTCGKGEEPKNYCQILSWAFISFLRFSFPMFRWSSSWILVDHGYSFECAQLFIYFIILSIIINIVKVLWQVFKRLMLNFLLAYNDMWRCQLNKG